MVSVLLGLSYLLRRKLKGNWMKIHRVLTVCLIVLVLLHVFDVGIQLPQRILGAAGQEAKQNSKGEIAKEAEEKGEEAVAFSGARLKDGTYEGEAEGYQSTIKVAVTVENSAVTDIQIVEENDTPNFFERAKKIVNEIISGQTLEVDAVSGATFSSAGILNAVKDALEDAVVEGELESNDIDLSAVKRHGHHGR